MNAKEKADELIIIFEPFVTIWDCYNDCPEKPENIIRDAKLCAYQCAIQCKNAVSPFPAHGLYWDEVIGELMNIKPPTP